MKIIKRLAIISLNSLLVVAFMFAALGPKIASAQPTNGGKSILEPFSASIEKYKYPLDIKEPTRTSPEPDVPPSEIPAKPAKSDIDFSLVATPNVINKGDKLTLTVTVQNNSAQSLSSIVYKDKLENGLAFVPGTSDVVNYDSKKQEISYSANTISPSNQIVFSYSLQVTSANPAKINGEVWIHSVDLTADKNVHMKGQTSFVVGTTFSKTGSSFTPEKSTGGWHSLGNFSIYLDQGSIKKNSILALTPYKIDPKGPPLQVKLQVLGTDPQLNDLQGNPTNQSVGIQNPLDTSFTKPAYMEIKLDGIADLKHIPAGKQPYVATYDEVNKIWVKAPILATDTEHNSVTVKAAHFSVWGSGLGTSMPQNGTGALLFDQPYTSLFTGSSRYSIPIWTPAGRAGMAPSLSLSYSSATVDGILGDVQAPWVGVGWNMDDTEIVRKITTDSDGYGYENSFALTLNGQLYELVRDEYIPSRYYVKLNAFLYVERHSYALGNTGSTDNATGEWWEVVTTDGMRYRLGWNADSEQLALMYGYSCTDGGQNCFNPDGVYASLGYAGKATNLVARRWRVDQVTDTHGNFMQYTYTEYQPDPASGVPPFDRESYLDTVSFTGHKSSEGVVDHLPDYEVHFVLANRSTIGDLPTTYNMWDFYDNKFLDKIEICYGSCTVAQPVILRTYDLSYSLALAPNANGSIVLSSLDISGGDFSENGISIPPTRSASVSFDYVLKPNTAISGMDPFKYPRLASIDNGYGGKLAYTYGNDGRGDVAWYNYRVSQALVTDGMGTAALQLYTYQTPVYSNNALVGYTSTTETTADYENSNDSLLDIVHTFGTTGLDIGHELTTEWINDGTLQKVVNTYVTDNSRAPFFGWNYRYLYQTENYKSIGGNLSLVSKTIYQNDPSNGNLLLQRDYLGSSLYRNTYIEYKTNADPSVYILDKASRQVLTDASNQVYSDIRYFYDGTMTGDLTSGLLTLTQVRTGNGDETVDTATSYDSEGYGNPVSNKVYKNYGVVDSPPGGLYEETTTSYDSTLYTYPVSTTNALGQTSSSSYLYTLGLAYQTTDPNGWITRSTFDGLGRSLSVTSPGLNQPGVIYSYPKLNSTYKVDAPYAIEMQILDTLSGVYRSVWGIYDGLGRIRQNQVYDSDSQQVLVTDTSFNPQGKPYQQSVPHNESFSGGNYLAPNWGALTKTVNTYDALGRITSTTAPGNIVINTSYDGLTTTVENPNPEHDLTRKTTDGFGRLIQVGEYNGSTLYATTLYKYDAANHLISTTDAQGNISSMDYDWLGRKTSMYDLDMGSWSYVYDPMGNLIQQTDANTQVLSFHYDDLNRLLEKWDFTHNTRLSSYAYGTSSGSIGQRISMSDSSGSTNWTYSNYGRTITENRTIDYVYNDNVSKSITTNSDWLGRVVSITYPGNDVITYHYDSLGRPKDFNSSAELSTSLATLAYNAVGQITGIELGNDVTITNEYNPALRLSSKQAVDNASNTLMDFAYTYDKSGNITHIDDSKLSESHSYTYDGLNRLVTAHGVQGQTDVYNQTFTYDKIGDILQVENGGPQASVPSKNPSLRARLDQSSQNGVYVLANYNVPYTLEQENQTDTPTPTPTETVTPTETTTPTVTSTPTITTTPTITDTPIPTNTPVVTYTPTNTYTPVGTLTPTPSATNTQTVTPSSGLILYWKFDDYVTESGRLKTVDESDANLNLKGWLRGNTLPYWDGYSARAVSFDGVAAYISSPASSAMDTSSSFSVSAWINPQEIATDRETRIIERDGNFVLGFNENGYLQFQVTGLTPSTIIGPLLPTDTWTYVLAEYDKPLKQIRLYVNAVLVASASVTGTRTVVSAGVILGSSDSAKKYKGLIDEFRFYNKPLLESESSALYGLATATVNPTLTPYTNTPVGTNTPLPTNTPTPTKTKTPTRTPTGTLTPTKTPTSTTTFTTTPVLNLTPISPNEYPYGTGYDGILTVDTGNTYNLSTQNLSPHSCADGGDAVSYVVTNLTAGFADVSTSPSLGCLRINDEILLINVQGSTISTTNVGRYEFLRVASVDGSRVYFTTSKVRYYGESQDQDDNIGTASGQQSVVIQRVPNYSTVNVDGTLTANGWNGSKYGILAIRVSDTLTGAGEISMYAKGYDGGAPGADIQRGNSGESYGGGGSRTGDRNLGGGGGGGTTTGHQHAGGAGYGTIGQPTYSEGGTTYGESTLTFLFMGSGGGGGGSSSVGTQGGFGGAGGGIIFVAADTIGTLNSISTNGQIVGGSSWGGGAGGAGSGGSVMLRGNSITYIDNLSASAGYSTNRGGDGGVGRVAIYYGTTLNISTADPSAYIEKVEPVTTSTPTITPSPTSVPLANPFPYGNESDGDLTVEANTTYDMSIQNNGTRNCSDGGDSVSYALISLTSVYAQVKYASAPGCLNPGDEILLINIQSGVSTTVNTGNYEFLRISQVIGDKVYFTTPKIHSYGVTENLDDNIGTDPSDQKVIIQRVPNYGEVDIEGVLSAQSHDKSTNTGGMLVFRAATLTGDGSINMDARGYSGGGYGDDNQGGIPGESYGCDGCGNRWHHNNLGGGGAGGALVNGDAVGGGYGINGFSGSSGSWVGELYGDITLTRIFPGSGGGGGGAPAGTYGGSGGSGGGIIFLAVDDINFGGTLTADGGDTQARSGAGDGGAGSGGSIRVEGNTIRNIGSAHAAGGVSTGRGGNGGVGRTAVYYADTFAGSFSPNYLEYDDTENQVTDSIFNSSLETGDVSEWDNSSTGNEDLVIDPSASYWGIYGLKANTAASSVYVQDTLSAALAHYRARFYFNPNSFSSTAGNVLEILNGYHGTSSVVKLQLQKSSSIYQVRVGVLEGAAWVYSAWTTINNSWNALEIEYYASADTGQLTLWVNGTQVQALNSLDNGDNTLNFIRLGRLDSTTGNSGFIYFDDFDSRRISYIGTLPDPGTHVTPPTGGEGKKVYTYGNPKHLHAVTDISIDQTSVGTYKYDLNGNQTCRMENSQTFLQDFNVENRITNVELVDGDCDTHGNTLQTWSFIYDGDGNKVQQDYFDGTNTVTTLYFFGGIYEVTNPGLSQTITKYYAIAGMTVAMSDGTDLTYFLTDHLGSVIATLDDTGSILNEQRYLPFGKVRTDLGPATQTDFGYTFQRNLPEMGLYDYKARLYDPTTGSFIQPDSLVGGNRYMYVSDNPINFLDPSGFLTCAEDDWECRNSAGKKHNNFKAMIKNAFDWNINGSFTDEQLEIIYDTGSDIQAYINEITRGKGYQWMHSNLAGTNFVTTSWITKHFVPNNPHVEFDTIVLPNGITRSNEDIAHEIGHVWDNNSYKKVGVYFGGGVSDELNEFIGGNIKDWGYYPDIAMGLHFYNPTNDEYISPAIPQSQAFKDYRVLYGNGSTADYLAEVFALNIYQQQLYKMNVVPELAGIWVNCKIQVDARYP